MKLKHGHRSSFTIIEMLVVILVILILSVIMLRITSLAANRAALARATADLQALQNALNEYFSEYGYYPPVTAMIYEHENALTNYQSTWFRDVFLPAHNDPGPEFFSDMNRVGQYAPGQAGWHLNYQYGLVSHLWLRDRSVQRHWYDRDTDRDEAAKTRWAHFLSDVGLSGGRAVHDPPLTIGTRATYTNSTLTVRDPWGSEYQYRCYPPHLAYRLWSYGPDMTDNTSDDIQRNSGN